VLTKLQQARPSFRYRRWLLTGRPGALWYLERARVTALWREHCDLIVARHVARWPFSRPLKLVASRCSRIAPRKRDAARISRAA
jgi:hypothetical protein